MYLPCFLMLFISTKKNIKVILEVELYVEIYLEGDLMHTKIIATVGPASSSKEILGRLADAGVSIFRLNFSHGDKEFFTDVINSVRLIEKEKGKTLSIMQDLSGPKIRIGILPEDSYTVSIGDKFLLGSFQTPDDTYPYIPFEYDIILASLEVGNRLVLADGSLEFLVTQVLDEKRVLIESTGFGIITSRKGLALIDKFIPFPAITEKDKQDLLLGLELGVDAVAMSFVQTVDDVRELKNLLYQNNSKIPVVAKLERQNAIDNLDAIVAEADIIMVARGDLGVECALSSLPGIQKHIITTCNAMAKPVIVATQMLLSMVHNPTPTRAEVTDVANAVLDGADCVMLSEETAMGNYPVETVNYMRNIAQNAEEYLVKTRTLKTPEESSTPAQFLAYAACLLAEKRKTHSLAAHSLSGAAARQLSTCRPTQIIFALTPDNVVVHALNFSWGVYPVLVQDETELSHLIRVETYINSSMDIPIGAEIVITAGEPSPGAVNRGTNLVKIFRK